MDSNIKSTFEYLKPFLNEYLNIFEYLGINGKAHIYYQNEVPTTPVYVLRLSFLYIQHI